MKIEIGTLGTIQVGSDRYGLVVVEITKAGIIKCRKVTKDKKKWKAYGDIRKVRKGKDGKYREFGGDVQWFVYFGSVDEYRDRSF